MQSRRLGFEAPVFSVRGDFARGEGIDVGKKTTNVQLVNLLIDLAACQAQSMLSQVLPRLTMRARLIGEWPDLTDLRLPVR